MSPPRRIFLIGFMGAGKTSVGRRLALNLDYPFLDLDAEIEVTAGVSVRTIFAERGEGEFRRLESDGLARAAVVERGVVATGGGTVESPANREVMRRCGLQVFLDVPWPVLLGRLAGKADERPLFRDPGQAFRLYSSRLGLYRMADIVLRVRLEETVDEVAERIRFALPYRFGSTAP